jgi:hypothetical protein
MVKGRASAVEFRCLLLATVQAVSAVQDRHQQPRRGSTTVCRYRPEANLELPHIKGFESQIPLPEPDLPNFPIFQNRV